MATDTGKSSQGHDAASRGLYATIVADPPWQHDDGYATLPGGLMKNWKGGAVPTRPLPYSSMTLDEIRALPVRDLAAPTGARLFMWTTNRFLPEAFSVLIAWGFEYRQTLVWHKTGNPSPFGGSVAPNHAEFLLVAQRGDVPVLSRLPSSVIAANKPTNAHSKKPEGFLDRIEQISPGPFVELFARRARMGWDTWGDEALHGTEAMSA